MCDPGTLLAGSIGLSAVGNSISAEAARAEGEFNSRIASINRQLALNSSSEALIKGEQEATISRLNTASAAADQTVNFAASNVVVGQGSAESVVYSTEAIGALDAAIIRQNASRASNAYLLEAEAEKMKGQLARAKGKAGATAAGINFFGDVLGALD